MSAPDIFSQSPSHCSTFKIHPVEMDLSSEPPPARRVRRMTASAINKIESPTINRQVSELAKHLDNFIPTGTRGKGEKQPPDAPSSNAIVLLEQTVSDRYIEPTTKQTLATLAGPALDSPGASRLCPAETPEPLHLPRKSSVEQDWTDGTREVVIDTEIGPQLFALGSDFKVAPDENQSDLSVSHDVFSESEREMETEKWLLDEISAKNREIESLQREKRADAFEIAKLKRNFHSKLRELEQVSQAEQEWLRQANLDLEKSLSYSIQAREQVENRINQFGNDPNDPSHDSELVSRLEAQIFVAANEIKAQKEQNDDLLQNTVRLNARIMEMEYQISTERNSSIVSKKTLDLVQLDPQAELRLIQNERDELREKVTYEIRESNNQNEHINDIRHDPDLTSRLEAQLVDAVNEAKVQQEQNEKLAQTIVKLSAKMQEIQSQFKTEREIVVLSKKTLESTQLEAQAELSLLQRDLDELREKLTSSEAQNTKKQVGSYLFFKYSLNAATTNARTK
ncbi:hypothetical protein BC830DRAFT_96085 [Chytriomyces sp. MP71]|nr:hypothetical protein BC830DRAFT_96085 [Chytriomyces sp. MP71]